LGFDFGSSLSLEQSKPLIVLSQQGHGGLELSDFSLQLKNFLIKIVGIPAIILGPEFKYKFLELFDASPHVEVLLLVSFALKLE
jgi:hypothetical protein